MEEAECRDRKRSGEDRAWINRMHVMVVGEVEAYLAEDV
jgi:hypothetical protein